MLLSKKKLPLFSSDYSCLALDKCLEMHRIFKNATCSLPLSQQRGCRIHSVTSAQDTASLPHCAAILGRARTEIWTRGLCPVTSFLWLCLAHSQVSLLSSDAQDINFILQWLDCQLQCILLICSYAGEPTAAVVSMVTSQEAVSVQVACCLHGWWLVSVGVKLSSCSPKTCKLC